MTASVRVDIPSIENAYLIAAAPDMYKALKEILSQIDQGGDDGKVFSRDYCITRARNVLNKARGNYE